MVGCARAERRAARGVRTDRAEAVAISHPTRAAHPAAPVSRRGALRRKACASRGWLGAGRVDLVRPGALPPWTGLGRARICRPPPLAALLVVGRYPPAAR